VTRTNAHTQAGEPASRALSPGSLDRRPKKTALLSAQRIVENITDRRLSDGDTLPPEREMIAQYGISRGSLREALRFLELQGVITMRSGPSGGPVVTRPGPEHLASMLGLLLELSGAKFRAILEARELLEPALAARAARGADRTLVALLNQSVKDMKARMDDETAFFEENSRFHSLIARGSGNALFGYLIESLKWITDGTVLGVGYSRRHRVAIVNAHQTIVEAIEAHDPDAAQQAMEQHMAEAVGYLDRRYPELLDHRLRWREIAR
jgi:GntR family transcriptional regulator, transcriptional repressor for pyruvate dehydrogenase complex